MLLDLNLAQQIAALLEHLRVLAATVCHTVVVVHFVVINVVVGVVKARVRVPTRKKEILKLWVDAGMRIILTWWLSS